MQLPVLSPPDELPIGEESSTEKLIEWTLERFVDQRTVITTGFGMEGCALIEMYAAHGKPLDMIYLDTMFFLPGNLQPDRQVEEPPPAPRFHQSRYDADP